jgi:hypothetical protein
MLHSTLLNYNNTRLIKTQEIDWIIRKYNTNVEAKSLIRIVKTVQFGLVGCLFVCSIHFISEGLKYSVKPNQTVFKTAQNAIRSVFVGFAQHNTIKHGWFWFGIIGRSKW